MKRLIVVVLITGLCSSPASAIQIGAAPEGEATVVAQTVILQNFDKSDCPLVVSAQRLGDGSIKAVCNNGESYRVFSVAGKGNFAMRCSALASLGVSGC